MEAFLGYLLGVGTVVAIAKRGKEARGVVAWTARQVGFISGKVSATLKETSELAREEYQRARVAQIGEGDPDLPNLEQTTEPASARPTADNGRTHLGN